MTKHLSPGCMCDERLAQLQNSSLSMETKAMLLMLTQTCEKLDRQLKEGFEEYQEREKKNSRKKKN